MINLPEIESIASDVNGSLSETRDVPTEIGEISTEAPGNLSDDSSEGALDDESDNSTLTPSSDGWLMFCYRLLNLQ